MAATKYFNPESGQWEYLLKGAPANDGRTGNPGPPGPAGNNGINTVVAGPGVTINTTDPANPVISSLGNASYVTLNTLEDYPGQYTKLASVDIYSRFENAICQAVILGFADGESYISAATVRLRVKQNAVMGQEPLVDLEVSETAALVANDFIAVTTFVDASRSTVELWGCMRIYYQGWAMYPLGQELVDGVTWYNEQPFSPTLPAGTKVFGSYSNAYLGQTVVHGGMSVRGNISAGFGVDPSVHNGVNLTKTDGSQWVMSNRALTGGSGGSLMFYFDDGAEGYTNTLRMNRDGSTQVLGPLTATNLSGTNTGDQWLGGKQDAQPNNVLRNYDLVGFERNAIDTGYTNKLAFMPPAQVLVEKSSDGGATWVTDTVSDAGSLANMFAQRQSGSWFDSDFSWRFTFDAFANPLDSSERYVTLDTLYLYTQTDGDDVTILVERALMNTPTIFGTVVAPTTKMNTWPGHVVIKHDSLAWGGHVGQNNTRFMRVTFTPNRVMATSFAIHDFRWYGGDTFHANYQVVKNGTPYQFYSDGVTAFTTSIYPTTDLNLALGTWGNTWARVHSRKLYLNSTMYIDGTTGGTMAVYAAAQTEIRMGMLKGAEDRVELVLGKQLTGNFWVASYRKDADESSEFWLYNYHGGVWTNAFRLGVDGTIMTPGDLILNGTDRAVSLKGITSEPAVPAANFLKFYSKKIAGRMVPKIVGPSGIDTPLQNAFWQNNIVLWTPTAATAGLWTGTAGTSAGTYSGALPTTTSLYTAMKRSLYANIVTTANQVLTQRATEAMFFLGNSAGMGGFFMFARMGFDVWTNGARFFGGMFNAVNMINANSSTVNNNVGFAVDDSDNGLIYFQSKGTGSVTRVSTGFTITSGSGYDLYLYAAPNSTTVNWRIVEINTGAEASGSSSATMPAVNVMMFPGLQASNGALTPVTSVQLGVNRIYVEADR